MIDVHMHLWPIESSPDYMTHYFEQRKKSGQPVIMSCQGILDSMDASGIDRSIISVLAFDEKMSNQELEPFHRYVEKQVLLAKGRLAAFCTIQPFENRALEILKEKFSNPCFKGLKLHPNIQKFYTDDERLYPLYQWLEEKEIPVLFHTGGIGLKGVKDCFGAPERLDNVACDFPRLPIIMGHAGRIHYQHAAELLRKHPNVYADISTNFGRIPGKEWLQLKQLLEIIKIWTGNVEKLMLGSDYPFYSQQNTVEFIQKLKEQVQGDEIINVMDLEQVLYTNAEKFCRKYHIFKEESV